MKTTLLSESLCLAMAAVLTLLWTGLPAQGRQFEWQTATPESQGMSAKRLDALKDSLAAKKTKAFLVIRNDKIVYEWYAKGHAATLKHFTASLIKAILAGLGFGVAASDGLVNMDDLAAKFIPEWVDDPRKAKITLRHLGSHTSGLDDASTMGVPHEKLPGWMGDFWKRLDPPNDPFTISRDRTHTLFVAGEKLHYSNPGIAMLNYAVTAALKDAPQKDLRTLMRDRIMRPIGVPDEDWSVGYGKTYNVKGLPLVAGWGGGNFTARSLARVGRLMLRQGDWDGKQLLSKEAVRQITGDAGLPGNCGMGWWTNAAGRYPKLPKDAFWGAGAGDQVVLVVPSLNLIVVRNGDTLDPQPEPKDPKTRDVFALYHDPRTKALFDPLIDAITDGSVKSSAAPYPASKVITGIDWAPKEAIVRQAKGSDNWPLTWGDDDAMYTAYGDGWGFEPFVPKKLGLGFARIDGAATDFKGVNIRSPSGEQIGDGAKAKKASGILMVRGILYLWTRNAGNSQLAWSTDHGKTWLWSEWKFTTSFGCPTFLNFGKNYSGARDEFVYVYSHDADSAYTPADRMVLARVPKDRIKEQAGYEFFKGLDVKKQPVWTKAIDARGAVFAQRDRCCRSTVSYHAGLKRYLWVQILPGPSGKREDRRFEGGFGIYDAPEPWGPWTTAYFTEKWDVGPGETASLPTKWMDGKTLYLVFSGNDSFCVRQASLVLGKGGSETKTLVQQVVTAAGGEDKLLKLFRVEERLYIGADPNGKGKERVAVMEPPNYWWQMEGKAARDRGVNGEKERSRFLVWAWTLGALTDPKSKLEAIPEIMEGNRPAFGLKVSGTINPPMSMYFDKADNRLVRIDALGQHTRFSDWQEHDGAKYPARIVGYHQKGNRQWYISEVIKVQRLKDLPEGLKR